MAQSVYTRRQLGVAMGSQPAANAIITIIDAQTGTLSLDQKRRLFNMIGTIQGNVLATALAAGSALTDVTEGLLTQSIGATATVEISDAQAA